MTRRAPKAYPIPQRTKNVLLETEQRMTIRRMLSQGGTVTPIGPDTHIRIPSGGFGTFPTELVDAVRRERLAWPADGSPAGFPGESATGVAGEGPEGPGASQEGSE